MKTLKVQIYQADGKYTAECEDENGKTKTIGPFAFAEFFKKLREQMKRHVD